MDILSLIAAAGGAASGITGVAGLVGKAAGILRGGAVTDDGFIRAYYLEVTKNLQVLEATDIKGLRKKDFRSPAFRALVGSLETEMAVTLFCSDREKLKRVWNFLEEGLDFETRDEEGENPAAITQKVNVLKAAWFTVQKLEFLKTLAAFESGDTFGKNFYLDVRIGNINECLTKIHQKLEENEAITGVIGVV